MFDKLKQIKKLKKLKDSLGQEKIEVQKNGTKVVLNGNMETEQIQLNPELDQLAQQKAIKEAFNQAVREIRKKIAQKMSSMGKI